MISVNKVIELADAYVLHYAELKRFKEAIMQVVETVDEEPVKKEQVEVKESEEFENTISGKRRKKQN